MAPLDFKDYKDYLRARIRQNSKTRGYQSKLALAAGCQKSFLSQVLNTNIHLTPDHAFGLLSFWQLPESQADYFMTLVHLARAAKPALRSHLSARLDQIRKQKANLAARFSAPTITPSEASLRYYSSWELGAVHMLLTTKSYKSSRDISKRLKLSEERTVELLTTLERMKLAKSSGQSWAATSTNIHLGKGSPLLGMHLGNWRQRALQSALSSRAETVHYSGLYTLSATDYETLISMVVEFIERTRQLVVDSPGEDLCCFNCDLFWV